VTSVLGGRFARLLPPRAALLVGQLLSAAGWLSMRGVEATSTWSFLLPGLLLVGVGIGLGNPAVTYTALGVVPATRSGMASGVNNTFRQVGLAIGIAALGALLPAGAEADPAAFAAGIDRILVVSAAVATLGAVLAVTLVRQRDFVVDPVPAPR
jgi:Major Facilitator Superfamily